MAADQGDVRPRRRATKPEERGRVAERTRERILAAAVAEFGAKGYSGARTASIAERAGVNQQLISYHFGGKQGLLDELRGRWATSGTATVPPDATFEESFATHLDAVLDQPDWARLVIWQALGDDPGNQDKLDQEQRERLRQGVERIRQRQRDGELADDVDPEFALLLSYMLAFAPLALPKHVAGIFGVDPLSQEYRERCRDQLAHLLRPDRRRHNDH
ncbi:TetR/AcrR family transcriptional regulator [Kibdelosporangium phytohabitans]|uniref:TetR family transcriptional regulator n=1 Tax=Kibdelosporangium phytohabitans TaxID=860235 RepID=A0A0N7F5S7_9PSEU|nr:TetR/AcrR family transcriptional regulator [Kibdelosporangium phytohabitans]ALG15063.1 TetR family transcriptional regulator [Kibdelosporangium phytohabitans]MBE1468763.1 AcrR family transcriptional regulator [Kibdelosporangium phytohabitans]